MISQETYFALSTPNGRSATATIRLSGPNSKKTILKFFRNKNKNLKPGLNRVVSLYNKNNDLIDRCVVVYYKGPKSFTGDDMVEIHTHGNPVIIDTVSKALLDLGVRHAEAGEFTRAALLNNKIDLIQAESLLSLINAKSITGVQISNTNLAGSLTKRFKKMRELLIKTLGLLEYELDISETDNQKEISNQALKSLKKTHENATVLISSTTSARINIDGARIVIFGEPNVGKSSLFNALLAYKRSIVTEIAGTTRDSIQESLNIGKHNTVLIDTAGIRNTKDKVEQLGIDRSNEEIKNADILLHIIDSNRSTDYKKHKNQITVLNKIDLLSKDQKSAMKDTNTDAVLVSAKDKAGINLLIEKIEKKLNTITNHDQNEHITSLRQEQLLIKINKTILPIIKHQETNIEIIAHHTKEAINHFDHLLGKTSVDDILDDVFSNFCVGK
jgi:tRNA modification GTPase